ncbi:ABC transporter permease [Paraburkholderia sp.]|uniref:ABC transporter permease n=1 Tax=Paraburkholderia sp. TaxID=1926495 RepID=UPI00238FC7AF|nr:ABC transporter permease [Paraburkholderia sp.]MDE1180854.1 ABC transporter permease [Paraburkholderia sp.]
MKSSQAVSVSAAAPLSAARPADVQPPTSRIVAGTAWRIVRRYPLALVGALLLLAIVTAALFADRLFPGDPLDMVSAPLTAPFTDPQHWLGTDSLGRDVAAGIVHGARASLSIGVLSALLGVTVGTLIGACAGFFGGRVDALLSRITEIFQTTPSFLFVIVIVTIGQPSLWVISFAIGVTSWPTIARLVRAEFRSLVTSEFVTAARSLGYGPARIIFSEVLPNALPPIIVTASVMVASAVLTESALAFLGQGDPNRVSWGSMIGDGRQMLRTAWYLTVFPGAALVVTILSLNLLGDGLNEAFNPRLRERR